MRISEESLVTLEFTIFLAYGQLELDEKRYLVTEPFPASPTAKIGLVVLGRPKPTTDNRTTRINANVSCSLGKELRENRFKGKTRVIVTDI